MYLWKVTANSARAQFSKWPPPPFWKIWNFISLAQDELDGQSRCRFPLTLACWTLWNGYFWVLVPFLWLNPNLVGNRVGEHDDDVRCYSGTENRAVARMRSKNKQYNPCYRNNLVVVQLLWARYHVPQNVFLVRWKSTESVLKSHKFCHFQGNGGQGIKHRCQNIFRNRLNRRLCACAVKT